MSLHVFTKIFTLKLMFLSPCQCSIKVTTILYEHEVYVDGKMFGSLRAMWMNVCHRYRIIFEVDRGECFTSCPARVTWNVGIELEEDGKAGKVVQDVGMEVKVSLTGVPTTAHAMPTPLSGTDGPRECPDCPPNTPTQQYSPTTTPDYFGQALMNFTTMPVPKFLTK